VRNVVAGADDEAEWLLLDAEAMLVLDITGAEALDAVRADLAKEGVELAIARARVLFQRELERSGVAGKIGTERLFPTVREGVRAFKNRTGSHVTKV
jgi:SulP family sulfate permease